MAISHWPLEEGPREKLLAQGAAVLFVVLTLDTRHQLLEYRELFQGTINGANVHAREVVKLALSKNAAAVIVAHNHPSVMQSPVNRILSSPAA